jgi:hypothetical protein
MLTQAKVTRLTGGLYRMTGIQSILASQHRTVDSVSRVPCLEVALVACMICMVLIYYVNNASEVDSFSLKCKTSTSQRSIPDAGKRQVIMHKTGEFNQKLLLRLSIEKG